MAARLTYDFTGWLSAHMVHDRLNLPSAVLSERSTWRRGREISMDEARLRSLLAEVRAGTLTEDDALAQLRMLPYEDLGYARIDMHRAVRTGMPETVYCPGKTPAQVASIMVRLA